MNDAGPSKSRELRELLSAACDGKADAATLRRIEDLVRNDPAAAELVASYAWLHTEMWRSVSAANADRAAHATLADSFAETGESPASPTVAMPRQSVHRARRPASRSADRWGLLALAASALVAAVVALQSDGNRTADSLPKLKSITLVRPPLQIACVTRVDGAVWAGGVERNVGTLLPQGESLELVKGTAQISMVYGADMVLQAPCRLVLAGRSRVHLQRGKLSAEVAPWAHGFVVETSGLRVTDLGTRFAVSAESSDVAEVHVLEGSVVAEPLNGLDASMEGVTLKSGQAMRVNSLHREIVRLAARGNQFVSRLEIFRPLRPIELPNTGVGLKVGDNDPHWIVTAGADASQSWPIPAVVGQPASVYRDNAPDASQWISVPEGTTKGVPPYTTHTFETTFNLIGFDLSTVRLIGQILADNGVTAIRLNGKPVDIVPWEERVDDYDFQTFHVVRIHKGFIEGENRLEVDVLNTSWGGNREKLPTPMGLRVEWQAFGRPPESAPPPTGRLDETL